MMNNDEIGVLYRGFVLRMLVVAGEEGTTSIRRFMSVGD